MDPVVAAAVADAHRSEWGSVLAAAARLTGDLDEAQECAQDAFAHALASWPETGVPAKPGAWLTMVARRRAMDLLRRRDVARAKLPLLADPAVSAPDQNPAAVLEGDEFTRLPDDRLRWSSPAATPHSRRTHGSRSPCGCCAGCPRPRSPRRS